MTSYSDYFKLFRLNKSSINNDVIMHLYKSRPLLFLTSCCMYIVTFMFTVKDLRISFRFVEILTETTIPNWYFAITKTPCDWDGTAPVISQFRYKDSHLDSDAKDSNSRLVHIASVQNLDISYSILIYQIKPALRILKRLMLHTLLFKLITSQSHLSGQKKWPQIVYIQNNNSIERGYMRRDKLPWGVFI